VWWLLLSAPKPKETVAAATAQEQAAQPEAQAKTPESPAPKNGAVVKPMPDQKKLLVYVRKRIKEISSTCTT